MFMTHSGLLRSYTPASAGPIIRCSAMWQAVQIILYLASPFAAKSVLICASKETDFIGPTPLLLKSTGTPSVVSTALVSFLARLISKPSFFSSFLSPHATTNTPSAKMAIIFFIVIQF